MADELLAQHERVIVAPTSHILEPLLPPDSSLYLSSEPDPERLIDLLDHGPRVIVAAARDQSVDFDPTGDLPPARPVKLRGLPPATIDQLTLRVPFATWLIEADGSRRHLLKAPAAHEPPIPSCATDVIIVASLDAIDRPLDESIVHRADLFAALADAPLDTCPTALCSAGQPLTPDRIARALLHPHGGLKNIPPLARVSILLTQRDPSQLHPSAMALIDRLAQAKRFDYIVAACLRADHAILHHSSHRTCRWVQVSRSIPLGLVTHHVAGILLAAGQAARLDHQPKQLLDWHGRTLIEVAIDTALAAGLDPVIVVVGAYADRVRTQIGQRRVIIVDNADWPRGQSTSVKAGLAALPAETEAVVFMPIDQPNLTPDILRELIATHARTGQPIVVASVDGKRTTPVLFHRSLFDDIRTIEGDRGARQIIDANPSRVTQVEVDADRVVDIDTLEDYNRAKREAGSEGQGM
jgi:molybdenum cofactor cytidylyltransferase